MFGWFKKNQTTARVELSDARVQELVSIYAELLQDRNAAPKSISALPASKEEMDAALLRAIELTPEGAMRQHLRNAFLWLADHQNLTAEEAAACLLHDAALNQPGDGSAEDLQGRALALSETQATFDHWSAICLQEMQDRASELEQRFGKS